MFGKRLFSTILCFWFLALSFQARASEEALVNPPGRLALFLYAEVLSLKDSGQLKGPLEEFVQSWNQLTLTPKEKNSPSSTDQILEVLYKNPRFERVKLMLSMGFDPKINVALAIFKGLDGVAPGQKRFLEALRGTRFLSQSAEGRPAAVAIANQFIDSKDPLIKEKAKEILEECRRGFIDSQKFDLLALENFVGYGIGAKIIAHMSLKGITKSILASVGLHSLAIQQVVANDEKILEKKLSQKSAPIAQSIAQNKLDSGSPVAPDSFTKRLEDLLIGFQGRETQIADELAEIIFLGEVIEHVQGRHDLRKSTIERLGDFQRIQRVKNKLTQDFDKYMKERRISKMDSSAALKLRQMMTPLVPIYGKDKQFWLPTLLGARGNCVARALLFSALYYPLFLKYRPDDLEFGLQVYSDHVEAILYHVKSQNAISLMAMQPVSKEKMVDILNPAVIIASYLVRRSNFKVPTLDALTLCKYGQDCRGIKLKLLTYLKRQTEKQVELPPQENNIIDNEINPSPFTSRYYANPMEYSSAGDLAEDNFDALNPNSNLNDFLNGKDIAPQKQGLKPIAADPHVLDTFVKIANVSNPSHVTIFKGDQGGLLVAPPTRPPEEDIERALDRFEIILRSIEHLLDSRDLNRKNLGPTIDLFERHRRAPKSKSSQFNIDQILETPIFLQENSRGKASGIWKSAPDFAKYVQQMACELIQLPKMIKIANGDEAAFDSLELREIYGFQNINDSIMNYTLTKSRSSDEYQTVTMIRQGVQLCGWDQLAEAVVQISRRKWKKAEPDQVGSLLKNWLIEINQEYGNDELQRKMALFGLMANAASATELGGPLHNAISRLKIKLQRTEDKPQFSGNGSLSENSTQKLDSSLVQTIQIRLITQPRAAIVAPSQNNLPIGIELRPDVFLELLLSEFTSPLFTSDFATLVEPLAELKSIDLSKLNTRILMNKRMTTNTHNFTAWEGLNATIFDEVKSKNSNSTLRRASQASAQIHDYLRKAYDIEEARKQ